MQAERAVHPLLSELAFRLHVPIAIANIQVQEIATADVRTSLTTDFREMVLGSASDLRTDDDYGLYVSLYREALNASSPAYRFLCMYKIIEGVYARRKRLGRRRGRKANGDSGEAIPGDLAECALWLAKLFDRQWDTSIAQEILHPEIRGKHFQFIVNSILRRIRNRVAHGVLRGGEPSLLTDEPTHLSELYRWLPLTQCIARHLLEREFHSAS